MPFFDTNILVYAHAPHQGERHEIARGLLIGALDRRDGVLSTQVLQELYVTLRREGDPPMSREDAAATVDDMGLLRVIVNDRQSIQRAIGYEERYRIGFWDALIVDAANVAGCDVLLTEDLNQGQLYGQVVAQNPFA